MKSTWESERETALQAARRAGEVMTGWMGRFTTRSKGQNDLVTEADLAVQVAIKETIARRFPDDDFLGEEDATDVAKLRSARRWIVDPIDGTTNFVHGFPFFGTSIALEVAGEIVVGVIFDPSKKETFLAVKGQGSACNGNRLQVSSSPRLAEGLICVGLPAVPAHHPETISGMVRMTARTRSVRRMGSAALSMAYVAAGRSDGFYSHIIQPWDVAAGVLLVQEAGGKVTNFGSDRYDLYNRSLLATNGLLHEEVARELSAET
ncbi:inositol monophosphatase [bacterium]|nr:inositol monophosphatase [bacterium]